MIPFRTGVVIPSIAVAFLLCVSACQSSQPAPPGIGVESHGLAKLLEKSPIDVAVAPVHAVASADVPTAELRACFHKGLVARRYSPLAIPFVDSHVVDAAYQPGSSNEQAVMTIDVERWDTSLWKTHNVISARIQVRLVDASNGEELWSGRVDQRFEFGTSVENLATETARMKHACDTIASEILEKLPPRNPQVAP